MDCIVHGVTKSRTRLSNFHFLAVQCCVGFSSSLFSLLCGCLCLVRVLHDIAPTRPQLSSFCECELMP